jgi:mannosyltransferase
VTPSWANRYLAIVVGPVVVAGSVALGRAGRLGLVTTAAVSVLWLAYSVDADRSNARAVAAAAGPLPAGTTVVSTQPEQVPLLAYYLGEEHRYVTPLGPVADPLVMDWRDALARLRRTGPPPPLDGSVTLVVPTGGERGWDAPWQREVLRVSDEWRTALLAGRRLARSVSTPPVREGRTDVRLLVLERR